MLRSKKLELICQIFITRFHERNTPKNNILGSMYQLTHIYLWRFITSFYKDHIDKLIATSPPNDTTSLINKTTVKPGSITKKRGQPAKAIG